MFCVKPTNLLITHHPGHVRVMEYQFIRRNFGETKKIVCENVLDALMKIDSLTAEDTKINKDAIKLIFLEANLGKSAEPKASITLKHLVMLRSSFPGAHIHFISGGTPRISGVAELIDAFTTKHGTSITSGVGVETPLLGIDRIPERLRVIRISTTGVTNPTLTLGDISGAGSTPYGSSPAAGTGLSLGGTNPLLRHDDSHVDERTPAHGVKLTIEPIRRESARSWCCLFRKKNKVAPDLSSGLTVIVEEAEVPASAGRYWCWRKNKVAPTPT